MDRFIIPFSNLEESIHDADLAGPRDDALDEELLLIDRYILDSQPKYVCNFKT